MSRPEEIKIYSTLVTINRIAGLSNFNEIFEDEDTLVQMVKIANKAGAITTTMFGAIVALPDKNQLFD